MSGQLTLHVELCPESTGVFSFIIWLLDANLSHLCIECLLNELITKFLLSSLLKLMNKINSRMTEALWMWSVCGQKLSWPFLTVTRARFFCLFSAHEHAWAELRSAELSTSLQISFFLFLCELSSPWASSRNYRWSWASWEGVSRHRELGWARLSCVIMTPT